MPTNNIDRGVILGNLLLAALTGSPERLVGGVTGGLLARRLHNYSGPAGKYLRGLSGGRESMSAIGGSALGQFVGKALESDDNKKRRGLLGLVHGYSPADLVKDTKGDSTPAKITEPSNLKKESSMNTVEQLFKTATEALEEKVFVPTVLAKLAERGYKPETQEEAAELLKHAMVVRQGIANGEMAPIPMSQLDQNGEITKQAAEAANADFLAFAPEVEVDLKATDPVVKEAAEVLAWGFMQTMKEEQAKA